MRFVSLQTVPYSRQFSTPLLSKHSIALSNTSSGAFRLGNETLHTNGIISSLLYYDILG